MRLQVDDRGRLLEHGLLARFDPSEISGQPAPVQRYFRAAIAPGTPLATSAVVHLQGAIKLGPWVAFRGQEVLAPHRGLLFTARAAGIIVGSDRSIDGHGAMRWKLAGLVPVMSAEGPEIARSGAGRAGAEGFWLPTAMLPRYGVDWVAHDAHHISSRHLVGEVEVTSHLQLDDEGRVRSAWFQRWGDPDGTGSFGWHTFGGVVTAPRRFAGLMIPSAGEVGWGYGTPRWPESAFFRYVITGLDPAT